MTDISTEAVSAFVKTNPPEVRGSNYSKVCKMLTALSAERDALKVSQGRLVEAALGYRRVTWQKEWTMRSPQFLMDDKLVAAIDASRETL